MAVKKTTTKASSAPKAAAPKQAARAAASSPKSVSPKAAPKQAAAPKKKSAPVKLTDRQTELLKRVHDTREDGYLATKAEAKALDSLQTKKLIKRGAKDKASGNFRYLVSKAGEKHHNTPPTSPTA